MRDWRITAKGGGVVDEKILAPLKWRKPSTVMACFDLFDPQNTYKTIDLIFAVMASKGSCSFLIKTQYPKRVSRYLLSVERRGKTAGPAYERRMRAHFQKYKLEFQAGYSLPEPPTPELRAIYDSAARREQRPICDYSSDRWSGFTGGEFHWRKWPLNNIRISNYGI